MNIAEPLVPDPGLLQWAATAGALVLALLAGCAFFAILSLGSMDEGWASVIAAIGTGGIWILGWAAVTHSFWTALLSRAVPA